MIYKLNNERNLCNILGNSSFKMDKITILIPFWKIYDGVKFVYGEGIYM